MAGSFIQPQLFKLPVALIQKHDFTNMKWFIILILPSLMSCQLNGDHVEFIDKTFQGHWAETKWDYHFKKDGSFIFTSLGHFGNTKHTGKYSIIDNTILLNPDSDWGAFHGVLKEKLKMVNSDCLRDFDSNYYCSDWNELEEKREQEYDFQENTINKLDNLPIVITKKEEIFSSAPDTSRTDIRIIFDRIMVIGKEDYHVFSLIKSEEIRPYDFKKSIFMNFLVKKQPFEIYEHHTYKDSLSLIFNK